MFEDGERMKANEQNENRYEVQLNMNVKLLDGKLTFVARAVSIVWFMLNTFSLLSVAFEANGEESVREKAHAGNYKLKKR